MQNIGLEPSHVLFKQPAKNVFVFRQKDYWTQIYDMLIHEDPFGQVKFVRLSKVTVLNLHVIIMKPEI